MGTIKGAGRGGQQLFVDTSSRRAAARLSAAKTPVAGARLLNDRALPFFSSLEMGILLMLADRGTEYCGKAEAHDHELPLGVTGGENTNAKARHPRALPQDYCIGILSDCVPA